MLRREVRVGVVSVVGVKGVSKLSMVGQRVMVVMCTF
jgi:hypothetical protein